MASNNGLSRNFGRISQDDLITIIVKESDNPFATARDNATAAANNTATETTFRVHKALLTQHSEYFKNALTGNWEEAQTKTVALTDVSIVTFETFVHWLYTQELPKADHEWTKTAENSKDSVEIEAELAQLWCIIFGNAYLVADFRLACEYALVHLLVNKPPPYYKTIIVAFENLGPSSNILKLLVNSQVHGFHEGIDNAEQLQLRRHLPHAFLMQVIVRYLKVLVDTMTGTTIDECDYYNYSTAQERAACKSRLDRPSDLED